MKLHPLQAATKRPLSHCVRPDNRANPHYASFATFEHLMNLSFSYCFLTISFFVFKKLVNACSLSQKQLKRCIASMYKFKVGTSDYLLMKTCFQSLLQPGTACSTGTSAF